MSECNYKASVHQQGGGTCPRCTPASSTPSEHPEWQCSGCKLVMRFSRHDLDKPCPGCGKEHYWTVSIATPSEQDEKGAAEDFKYIRIVNVRPTPIKGWEPLCDLEAGPMESVATYTYIASIRLSRAKHLVTISERTRAGMVPASEVEAFAEKYKQRFLDHSAMAVRECYIALAEAEKAATMRERERIQKLVKVFGGTGWSREKLDDLIENPLQEAGEVKG